MLYSLWDIKISLCRFDIWTAKPYPETIHLGRGVLFHIKLFS